MNYCSSWTPLASRNTERALWHYLTYFRDKDLKPRCLLISALICAYVLHSYHLSFHLLYLNHLLSFSISRVKFPRELKIVSYVNHTEVFCDLSFATDSEWHGTNRLVMAFILLVDLHLGTFYMSIMQQWWVMKMSDSSQLVSQLIIKFDISKSTELKRLKIMLTFTNS
jgi:hypothetical protein